MRLGAPAVGAALAAGALILWNQDSNNRATASTALQPRTVEIPVSIINNVRSPQPAPPKASTVEEAPPRSSTHGDASSEAERHRNNGGGMSVLDIIKLTSPQQVPSDTRMGAGLTEQRQEQPPLPPPPPEIVPQPLLQTRPANDGHTPLQRTSHRRSELGVEGTTTGASAAAAAAAEEEETNEEMVPENGRLLRRKMGRAKSRGSAQTSRSRSESRDELSMDQQTAAAEASAPGAPSHWGSPTSESSSSSLSKQARCSAKSPTSGKLRVVSDITKVLCVFFLSVPMRTRLSLELPPIMPNSCSSLLTTF